jgi:hypothetical protein
MALRPVTPGAGREIACLAVTLQHHKKAMRRALMQGLGRRSTDVGGTRGKTERVSIRPLVHRLLRRP